MAESIACTYECFANLMRQYTSKDMSVEEFDQLNGVLELPEEKQREAFVQAAACGHRDVVTLLIERGFEVNSEAGRQARTAQAMLRSSSGQPPPVAIPRILHQTWKTSEVPSELQIYVDSWREHNDFSGRGAESWRHMFWNDTSAAAFIAREYPSFYPVYRKYRSGVEKADNRKRRVM